MKLLLFLFLPLCSSGQVAGRFTADDSLRFWSAAVAKYCIVESNLKAITSDDLRVGYRVWKDSSACFINNGDKPACTVAIKDKAIIFKFFVKITDNVFDEIQKTLLCDIDKIKNEIILSR